MNREAESIFLARDIAMPSFYYDHVVVPDAGDLGRQIADLSIRHKKFQYLVENSICLKMATLSASLAATGSSTLVANQKIRNLLLSAYRRMPVDCVGGVFGKTLWVFTLMTSENELTRDGALRAPKLDQVVDVLEPDEYSQIDCLHFLAWVSAVASALKRHCPDLEGRSSPNVVYQALMKLSSTDWECGKQTQVALTTLKAFTQPTWWVTMTPSANKIDSSRDLHFDTLLNERRYRRDMSTMDMSGWMLAVSDVSGLFLGSASHTSDLIRAADGRASRMGIAGHVLHSSRCNANTNSNTFVQDIFQERLHAAQKLALTLQIIARCAEEFGGRAYATHGDGVSIAIPQSRWEDLLRRLNEASMPMPIALGGVPMDGAPENVEMAAERALVRAKVSMVSSDQWIAAHSGDEKPDRFDHGMKRLQRLAESRDVVERWIGIKGLRSIAACQS